jgi:hypothetical protein
MDYLKNAIENYLNSEETFALCIDGGWGTGKTHFIKNFMPFSIDDIEKPQPYGNGDIRKVIYISLYGKGNVKEIKDVIISQILSKAGSFKSKRRNSTVNMAQYFNIPVFNISKLYSNLLSFADEEAISKLKRDLITHDLKLLIIIDDLERITNEKDLNELLGFIRNELLDVLESKVIIVGNLNELLNDEKLRKTKEKVVGRTLKFKSNLDVGLDIIRDNISKYINVNENINILTQLLSNSELIEESKDEFYNRKRTDQDNDVQNVKRFINNSLNLRTLSKVISDFKQIAIGIEPSIDNENKRKIHLSLFCSLFMVNNELKNGNFDEKEIRILQEYIDPTNKRTKLLYGRYYQGNKDMNYLLFVPKYLVDFVLYNDTDFKLLATELNARFNKQSKMANIITKLNSLDFDNDTELYKLENQLQDYLNKDIDINKKLDIYLTLYKLNKDNLLLIGTTIESLEKQFLQSYDLKAYKTLSEPLSARLILTFQHIGYHDEIKKMIIEHEKEITIPNYQEYINAILENDEGVIESIEKINKSSNEIYSLPYFKQYEDMVISKLTQSTKAIRNLHHHIAIKYLHLRNSDVKEIDKKQLIDVIKKVDNPNRDKVKNLFLEHLVEAIEEIRVEEKE